MQRNEAILDEVISLYKEKGLQFTMQDIASRMHMAKKTIYRFYSSKEEMLLDLVDASFGEIHQTKREIIESNRTIEEKIELAMVAMPDRLLELDFRGMQEVGNKYPAVAELLKQNLETNWEPIIQLLEQAMEEGKIEPINVYVLRTMITVSIEAFLIADTKKDGGLTYRETLSEMMRIVMRGLEARHAGN